MTVRLKLTALYGALFLAVGALLLAITYGLFARQLKLAGPKPPEIPNLPSRPEGIDGLQEALAQQRADALRELLTQSLIALTLVAGIAVALGWVVAGRVLRPLRDITATAQRLSTHNLDQRIAMSGPRDELKELADTFDAMLGRLAAAFEAQRRFVANASHELRTPLTVQRAAVDVALADPEPSVESFTAMAVRVRKATQRHERLIGSLLTLAKSEWGIEHYENVDLSEIVRAAVEGVDLKVTERLEASHVHGDPALIERLVTNLVDNACRHNVPDGWIDVEVADGVLRIANSGPAVADAAMLFEPFRRLDRGTDGHGLGLSIVSAIVSAHDGSLTARARPGGGLEVTVRLPGAPR